MTGLWGQAMNAEVAYRHEAARESYPRPRADRGRRRPRPVPVPMRRLVDVGAVGMAGATAGMMTASGRR